MRIVGLLFFLIVVTHVYAQPNEDSGDSLVFAYQGEDGTAEIGITTGDTVIPLTLGIAGNQFDPTVANNEQIAFVSDHEGQNDLYFLPEFFAVPTRLTSTGNIRFPTWSPWGTLLAYSYVTDSDFARSEIRIVDTETSDTYYLTDGAIPSWSPDGQSIVFSRDGDLFIIDLITLVETNLTNTPSVSELFSSFSPSGNQITYHDLQDSVGIIDLLNNTNVIIYNATDRWSLAYGLAWHPTGDYIAIKLQRLLPPSIRFQLIDTSGIEVIPIEFDGELLAYDQFDFSESSSVLITPISTYPRNGMKD